MHAAAAAIFLVSTMIAAAPEKPAPAQDSSEVVNARQRAVAFLTKKQGRNKLTEYGVKKAVSRPSLRWRSCSRA